MTNNDVLRSLRYMLKVNETKIVEIIKLGGLEVSEEQVSSYLKKDDEEGYCLCGQHTMSCFLNGLIYFKRGRDEKRPALSNELPTNNVVLKKLRVAFELRDEDIMDIFKSVDQEVSKSELSAFFRKEGHENFRSCGDQFLRYFLKGLTQRVRKP